MIEFLIVDGYNVIHAWPELSELMNQELEHARDRLIDIMANYGALNNLRVIVVFDAHQVKGGVGSYEIFSEVEVIYSQEGETADSVIERLVTKFLSSGRVTVATSDWSQQSFIFGKGAIRLSARELIEEVKSGSTAHNTVKVAVSDQGDQRLGARIKDEVKVILERIRRQK